MNSPSREKPTTRGVRTTKAGDWWQARREGRRLPEHEIPAKPEKRP
jgi:hypothetical protein